MQDGQRQVLGQGGGRLGRRDLEVDPLAAAEPARGPRGAAVHQHPAVSEQLLGAGAGEIGRQPGEGHVEAHPGQLGRGRELSPVGYQILDFTCPLDFRITSTMARS